MKTKEKSFNWIPFVLIFVSLILIFVLIFAVIVPAFHKQRLEEDFASQQTTPLFTIDKIVCYSNAYSTDNGSNQANWDLNLSQYTDIAIYLNSQLEMSSMYIDHISFSNSSTGNLSLTSLALEDFGKSINLDNTAMSKIVENPEKIDLSITSPITLRYLNQNLKENCRITDIDTPLAFDGSLLKRGKVILSSLKNTITFDLHVINSMNEHFTYPVTVSITLENKESGKSIYEGSYLEEFTLSATKS